MGEHEQVSTNCDAATLEVAQREIQRKLGRNLLRLQQVEQMLKAFWVDHEIFGESAELLTIQRDRKTEVADKTLGAMAKKLVGSFLTNGDTESLAGDSPEIKNPNKIHFGFKSSLSFSAEDFEREKATLEALITMRNELVHHFLENFDLRTLQGCATADQHLEACLVQINLYTEKLRGWADATLKGRELMVSFLGSEAGRDLIVFGIMPGGEIHWEATPIVAQLKAAEEALSCKGWTSLNAAIAKIKGKHPELTPRKYGCSRWRHLLHETGLFNTQVQKSASGAVEDVFFQSRVERG